MSRLPDVSVGSGGWLQLRFAIDVFAACTRCTRISKGLEKRKVNSKCFSIPAVVFQYENDLVITRSVPEGYVRFTQKIAKLRQHCYCCRRKVGGLDVFQFRQLQLKSQPRAWRGHD